MANESKVPSGQTDWDALARYFAGESSPAETATIRRWLAESPEEAAALATTDAAARQFRPATLAVDVDAAWQRTSARLDERPAAKTYPFAARRTPALRAAAAAVIVAGSAATLWWLGARPDATPTAAAAREFTTEPGRRDSVVLADGTGVLLGPGSWLRIDEDYGGARRDVHLAGEALFDVRHDDGRPFVVHVFGVMIQDLGTTFTIRTTNGMTRITTVAVTSGAVRVARTTTTADSGIILRAGDVGAVSPTGPIVVRRDDALEAALAWTRGQLVFRDAPLSEVAGTLRRWYGVEVRIADSALTGRTFNGSYDGEPLATVLNAIALGIPTRVQQSDSVVIIGGPSRR